MMDVFRFTNPNDPMQMEYGKLINGIKSKMWVERYLDPGEFTFVAPIDSNLREELPVGSFVSHSDTSELMIVENHEINETVGKTPEITITGRSFETILEARAVGSNKTFPVTGTPADYVLNAALLWNQAGQLVNTHITTGSLIDDNDAIPHTLCLVQTPMTGSGAIISRTIQRGTVYERFIELLKLDNLGIRSQRPGNWNPSLFEDYTVLLIHRGVTRTGVTFSYAAGEIETADYLWSNKDYRNVAYVKSTWVETVYVPDTPPVQQNRRVLYVDASSADQQYQALPTGGLLTSVIAMIEQKGREALTEHNQTFIIKPEVSKKHTRAKYRTDFYVGDIVWVSGGYTRPQMLRVSEYVEMEDENGEYSYPTFSDSGISYG